MKDPLFATDVGKRFLASLEAANISGNPDVIAMVVEPLVTHINTFAPILKKKPEDMLAELTINFTEDLVAASESTLGTRYFQFIGTESNLIADSQVGLAKQLEAESVSATDIINQTGLFKRRDGNWCGWLAEPDLKLNTLPLMRDGEVTLGTLMGKARILDAYPALRKINVSLFEKDPELNQDGSEFQFNGRFLPNEDGHGAIEINKSLLNSDNMKRFYSTLCHELSHVIQKIEKSWSQGFSKERVTPETHSKMIENAKNRYLSLNPNISDAYNDKTSFESEMMKKYATSDPLELWDAVDEKEEERLELLHILLDKADPHNKLNDFDRVLNMISELDRNGTYDDAVNKFDVYRAVDGEENARLVQQGAEGRLTHPKAVLIGELMYQLDVYPLNCDMSTTGQEDMKPAGWIDFYEQGASVTLSKESDPATMIHEVLGHYVYENLDKAVAMEGCPQWLLNAKNDFDYFCEHIGCLSREAKHERFASMMETHLLEGDSKHPSINALSKSAKNAIKALSDSYKINDNNRHYFYTNVFKDVLDKALGHNETSSIEP